MRLARALLLMCIACGDDGAAPKDPNPNLTVEPISIDAGVPNAAPAKSKRRVGVGDHRRREDEDARRRKSRPEGPADAVTAEADGRKADEERRHEAERRRMTSVPLEVLTGPGGPPAPIQTR